MSEEYYVITRKLKTEPYQEDILDKRFGVAEKLYNALNHKAFRIYYEFSKTRDWKSDTKKLVEIQKEINELKKEKTKSSSSRMKELKSKQKEIYDKRKLIFKDAKFTKYGFHYLMKEIYISYNMNIDSETAVFLADNCWSAWNSVLFGKGKKTKYKRKDELSSLAGATNKCGIRCVLDESKKQWNLVWNTKKTNAKKNTNKLVIPIQFKDDIYDLISMQCDIVYPTITRKVGKRKKYDYYVNIILKGSSPKNIDKKTGEFKKRMGQGKIGVYVGVYSVSCFDGKQFYNYDLCKSNEFFENKIKIIDKKMEEIRRINNPQNFNEDGTVKKQGNKKVKWFYPESYFQLKKERKYFFRKQSSFKKQNYIDIVNSILSLGSDFVFNELNAKFSQQEKGDIIKSSAPSMLMNMLKQNIDFEGGNYKEIKNGQFDYKHYDLLENKYEDDFIYSYTVNGTQLNYTEYFSYLLYFCEENELNREKCISSLEKVIKTKEINEHSKENIINTLGNNEEIRKFKGAAKNSSNRYAIYEKGTDNIIEDAQGFGFRSMQKAKNFKRKKKSISQ